MSTRRKKPSRCRSPRQQEALDLVITDLGWEFLAVMERGDEEEIDRFIEERLS